MKLALKKRSFWLTNNVLYAVLNTKAKQVSAVRAVGAGGASTQQILLVQLTPSKPIRPGGGQMCAPPDFQTFLQPCKSWYSGIIPFLFQTCTWLNSI